jgi:hypothetical protein
MPLVGGGGAPHTSGGANPAGTGSVLNYVGDHVYAYSGAFSATTSAQTTLEFTTGSEYIVGHITTNGAIQFSSTNGLKSAFQISINGEVVAITQVDNQTDHSPGPPTVKVVLPPYTTVKVEVDSDDTNASVFTTTMFTGRVYA